MVELNNWLFSFTFFGKEHHVDNAWLDLNSTKYIMVCELQPLRVRVTILPDQIRMKLTIQNKSEIF